MTDREWYGIASINDHYRWQFLGRKRFPSWSTTAAFHCGKYNKLHAVMHISTTNWNTRQTNYSEDKHPTWHI